MKRTLLALLALPLVAIAGCSAAPTGLGPDYQPPPPSPTDTSTVATADLIPSMSAGSDESGIHVWAALTPGFLTLGAGDSLTATVDGVTRTLTLDPTDSEAHYTTDFPVDAAATSVTISFLRTNGQASAPNNVVPLAPAFTVTAPSTTLVLDGQPDAAAVTFPVLILPSPAFSPQVPVEYQVNGGACVPSAVVGIDRAVQLGSSGPDEVLDLGAILDPTAQNCSVAVEIRQETRGTLDPAFANAVDVVVPSGVQDRTILVTENPSGDEDAGADGG